MSSNGNQNTVQTFTRAMVEQFLKSKEYKYLKDNDGDLQMGFSYDADYDCELTVWFLAMGKQSEIYQIRVLSDKRIKKADWGRAIMVCNQWNKEYLWPKAYLHIDDPDKDVIGQVVLENSVDLEKGVHQAFLDHVTAQILGTAIRFWIWAHKEKGF